MRHERREGTHRPTVQFLMAPFRKIGEMRKAWTDAEVTNNQRLLYDEITPGDREAYKIVHPSIIASARIYDTPFTIARVIKYEQDRLDAMSDQNLDAEIREQAKKCTKKK